jgi:predicted ABC-type ATPase
LSPVLLVVAGPNGAGKTTVTARLRQERWSEGVEYLNSPEAVLAAAKWTEARREELLAANRGIAFETVFSTQAKVDFVGRAKASGYFVRVFFIGTSDPRINAARVTGRVMAGGHTVPIEKIVSRYERSMANLSAAIGLADRVYVYDNSVDDVEARLCVRTQEGALRKIYGDLPEWVATATRDLRRHAEFVDARAA